MPTLSRPKFNETKVVPKIVTDIRFLINAESIIRKGEILRVGDGESATYDTTGPVIVTGDKHRPTWIAPEPKPGNTWPYQRFSVGTHPIQTQYTVKSYELETILTSITHLHAFIRTRATQFLIEEFKAFRKFIFGKDAVFTSKEDVPRIQKFLNDLGQNASVLPEGYKDVVPHLATEGQLIIRRDLEISLTPLGASSVTIGIWEDVGFCIKVTERNSDFLSRYVPFVWG